MYWWIWRRLPAPWPVRNALALPLLAGTVMVLFAVAFPWAKRALPFIDVTVDQ